jgi:hypothetical protein
LESAAAARIAPSSRIVEASQHCQRVVATPHRFREKELVEQEDRAQKESREEESTLAQGQIQIHRGRREAPALVSMACVR